MKTKALFSWLLLLVLGFSSFSASFVQAATSSDEVLALLEEMTPEERVGQLFLVTFDGTSADSESQIYDLIANYHVGGVMMLAENDNFTAAPDTIADAHQLISALQKMEWDTSLVSQIDPETGVNRRRAYVPLFVATTESGDSSEDAQILSGLTPLPNQMAIGATWQPELAAQTGAVLGEELSALGFNLYFGPSLDVLESPSLTSSGDLGTSVFGGNPFWVGEMGSAFINGMHTGSDGRILVVAKHFPGSGSSDRLPEDEISTVRKSLEQLTQVELAPFFTVTGDAPSALETADGLLVSHIRYEGFQGNVRATTRPVSLDAHALAQILELPSFTSWREAGGLTLSDDLGSRAVHEFYAPGDGNFYAHLVARDAFLAGNDLLYLGNILSSDTSDTYAAAVNTLSFFAQKYREDTVFAQRVDEAVTRILAHKMRIYPYFSLGAVRPSISRLDELGQASQATFDVAQRSATIISPTLQNLDVVLPTHPTIEDQIVFITDTYVAAQCSLCPGEEILAIDALPQSILRLYGEDAGGQALAGNLAAYSFDHLSEMLADEEAAFLESAIIQAEWVIISLAGVEQNQPEVLRGFLSEKQELLRAKNIILFSFTAPYYLDATDISKLTAYYALYSTAPPFVDVASRLLYKELTPIGASPVSIAGIGYDLATATSPNPAQFISLTLDTPIEPAPVPSDPDITPEPTQIPLFRVGDTLGVRTGIIVDHNNHSVPDGTVVTFTLTIGGDNGMQQQIEAETTQGVARAAFQLNETGLLDIRAASEPAIVSETLRLDISSTGEAAVTVIAPSVSQISTPVPDIEPIPTPIIQSAYVEDGSLRIGAWFFAALLWIFGALLAYWAGAGFHSTRWGIRWALSALLGGMGAYNYLALDFPATTWITASGMFGVISFVLIGEILGLAVGWLWWKQEMG